MNEREAIRLEMEELKEQGRRDWELYFEMRKHRNDRYTELQNRLREIDVRDSDREIMVEKQEFKPLSARVTERIENEKDLPVAKSADMTPKEMVVDRVARPKRKGVHRGKQPQVPHGLLQQTIEEFLRHADQPLTSKDIEDYVREKHGATFVNFNEVMRRVMGTSPFIRKTNTRPIQYTFHSYSDVM